MNWLNRKILYIDLDDQTYEFKNDSNLGKFIGGLGLSAKIMSDVGDKDSIIFSVGPLSGAFPFASKTSVFFYNSEYVDAYLGGTLSSRMKFAGIDSLVLFGKSRQKVVIEISDEGVSFKSAESDLGALGLPGKRSVLNVMPDKIVHDDYFEPTGNELHAALTSKNIKSIVVTGFKTFNVQNTERYNQVYKQILSQTEKITAEKKGNPSCFGCPMGCDKSKYGEIGGDVLTHSLVACDFASPIYMDNSVVFSCLNILGYGYTHEDIENFPRLVYHVLEDLKK